MGDVDLSDAQKEFLALGKNVERIKGISNVVAMFGGKEPMRDGIDELEARGLMCREAPGVWSLTEKGEDAVISEVSCEDCGRTFRSVEEARRSGHQSCHHNNLNRVLDEFRESSQVS